MPRSIERGGVIIIINDIGKKGIVAKVFPEYGGFAALKSHVREAERLAKKKGNHDNDPKTPYVRPLPKAA